MNWPEDFIKKIICGDCLEMMRQMPDKCIDMVMTSPPYWGLRDYGTEQIFGGDKDCGHEWTEKKMTLQHENMNLITGTQEQTHKKRGTTFIKKYDDKKAGFCLKCQAWRGQLGLEPTPEMYIEHLTEIFNEVKRVLEKEGTLWVNIGDTYNAQPAGNKEPNQFMSQVHQSARENKNDPKRYSSTSKFKSGLPPKCLCMIPERLAWSLIQNGWILRNKIIWHKPNAMPSSVKDRFSNRWEHIFLFSKSKKYYFDLDAVREPHKYDGRKDTLYKGGPKDMQIGEHERWPNPAGKNPGDIINAERKWNEVPGQVSQSIARDHGGWYRKDGSPIVDFDKGKNPGDFWNINTQPFPEAHFAVFPESLCEKPIKAGCPEQVCKRCGKAKEKITKGTSPHAFNIRVRDVKKGRIKYQDRKASQKELKTYQEGLTHVGEGKITIGWTSCDCKADFDPGIVLDPFAGTGTVGVVAKKLGRQFILIDIKKEYCDMAERRISKVGYQMELRI